MPTSGFFQRVALVITDVSEEHNASIIKVTGIGELGRKPYLATDARCGEILNTKTHGVTSQKTPFFIVTAVKT
jgi:hypothetical protein